MPPTKRGGTDSSRKRAGRLHKTFNFFINRKAANNHLSVHGKKPILMMLATRKNNIRIGNSQEWAITGVAIQHIRQAQTGRLVKKTLNHGAVNQPDLDP